MKVPCPDCQHAIEIKSIKAGRFKLTCPKCQAAFGLQIEAGPPVKATRFRLQQAARSAEETKAPAADEATIAQDKPTQNKPAQEKHSQPQPGKNTAAKASAGTHSSAAIATTRGLEETILPESNPRPVAHSTTATLAGDATVELSNGTAAPRGSTPSVTPTAHKTDQSSASANSQASNADPDAAIVTAASVPAASAPAVKVRAGGSAAASGQMMPGNSTPANQGVAASGSGNAGAVTARPPNDQPEAIPERLGGYRLLKQLGQGAMGAVYQAKQLSLDRNVALKVIRAQWAKSPTALARFTREAYAAAQLTHHNVVQIYDFGEDQGQHFFSMEWVRGGPLSDLVKDRQPLDSRAAAGYILQAARGLQFAHRNGMVHRDVKPANILLDEEGVIKVADLGLVKVPDAPDPVSGVGAAEQQSGYGSGSQVTAAGSTVGTPAYMAPEQTEDAAMVDHRADIYSLGCSLYHLLAGRPPFAGRVVSEVLEMQRRGTPPDLRSLNPRVSETLAQIVQRAMAKKLEDRYANLGEMITDLEGFLGLMGQASQTLTTDQADRLKLASEAFHGAALSKLRMPIVLGSVLLAALLSALLVLVSPKWALFPPLTMLVAIVTYLIVGAWQGRSPLASACRQSIAYSRWTDWLTWAAGLAVMLCAIYLLGMLTVAITGLVFGVAAGAAYGLVLDKAIAAQRRASLAELEGLVRELRLSGLDELQVRRLIARFSGKHWEESFEQLFGFRAVEPTRDELRRMNELENKSSFWPWRTWIIARLQRRLDEQKRQREQTKLVRIEKAGLQAEGLTGAEADARAWQMAAALMESAQPVVSATSNDRNAEIAAFEKRRQMKSMMADARSGKYRAPARPIRGTLAFVFGGKPRFLLGCVLLVAFALWARSNGIVGEQTLQQIKTDATQEQINQTVIGVGKRLFFANDTQPVLSGFVHGVGTAAAGLILVISALSGGVRMSVLTYPAAAIAFLGAQFGIPALAMVNAETVASAAGCIAFIPAILFGGKSK